MEHSIVLGNGKTILRNKSKAISLKQAKWLELYVKLGNATKAAQLAYGVSEKSASVIGHDNLQKVEIGTLLEAGGLGQAKLLKKTSEGLEATRTISAITTKQAKGSDTDFIEVPDYATRFKYTELGWKLHKKLDNNAQTVVVDKMLVLDGISAPKQKEDDDVA